MLHGRQTNRLTNTQPFSQSVDHVEDDCEDDACNWLTFTSSVETVIKRERSEILFFLRIFQVFSGSLSTSSRDILLGIFLTLSKQEKNRSS